MISGGTRLIFFGERVPMIDVFYDRLDYNHPIEYKGRLEADPYCVSLADLMLQKLQIVEINDKCDLTCPVCIVRNQQGYSISPAHFQQESNWSSSFSPHFGQVHIAEVVRGRS